LGFKGGHASVNHGHADAGSFILQWRGVDWSLDPGNQSYDQVEQVMGNKLWDRDQESPRWTLLSKNNFGHTCLTVNDQLHDVDGMATIQAFREAADTSYALIEMSAVYGELLDFAQRTIRQRNDSTVIITDEFETNSRTKKISWFLISTTNMRQEGEDIWLEKDGQQMKLSIESKVKPQIVIQSLDPPPLAYDIQIAGLKRLELIFPASAFADGKGHIRVRMAGQ
ncbi:MAG: heparinase II/III family protein, partial [Bacteroidota bacterium]